MVISYSSHKLTHLPVSGFVPFLNVHSQLFIGTGQSIQRPLCCNPCLHNRTLVHSLSSPSFLLHLPTLCSPLLSPPPFFMSPWLGKWETYLFKVFRQFGNFLHFSSTKGLQKQGTTLTSSTVSSSLPSSLPPSLPPPHIIMSFLSLVSLFSCPLLLQL